MSERGEPGELAHLSDRAENPAARPVDRPVARPVDNDAETPVRRRWDLDERGTGTASARALVPILDTLLEHVRRDGWVAEQPEAHLLPHLRRAASASGGSPWRLDGVSIEDDGTLELRLGHSGTDAWDAYQDAVRLLSVIAESAFLVRRVDEETVECLTGMLDGDGEFASHGHRIRLVLSVSAA